MTGLLKDFGANTMLYWASTQRVVSCLALGLLFGTLIDSNDTLALSRKAKQTISGTVVSVGDGDTLRAKDGDKVLTIRLACIDAPKIKQKPYGVAAANRLKQLLPIGQPITLEIVNTDRYARSVAQVYSGNMSINLFLVQEGYAVVYKQYLKVCPNLRERLISGEASAKSRRVRIWSQDNPVMPWDYRRSHYRVGCFQADLHDSLSQPLTLVCCEDEGGLRSLACLLLT
jgi:endonuclease YncB( thermonuclease family)